ENFTRVVEDYVEYQQREGADVVQIFDTWAGVLSPDDYERFVLPYHKRIVDAIDVPSIIFVRNPGGKLGFLKESGADVVSLDWTVDMAEARDELGDTPVQGNLDPSYLYGDAEFVRRETEKIIEKAEGEGHILNLGHGVHKDTPVENVREFVGAAKNYSY
ncbi:MAG: uroporphyrinogen decarboxylase family protein, partial [Halobacteria archaeon]|nr:uroporphyrinogen decarboxylase family protein [Halobacteria archaeon]